MFSDEERQSQIAPVPLAPQPTIPIFILSLPCAKSLPELASIVAIETEADDLMKSRRDKFENLLLFMNNPFPILNLNNYIVQLHYITACIYTQDFMLKFVIF